MKELTQELFLISGGNPVVAISIYTTVFSFPASIIGALDTYDNLGHKVGEIVFDYYHPDPLEQMRYTAEDFKD